MSRSKIKITIIKKLENTPHIGVFILYILRVFKLYFYYKPRFFINQFKNQESDIFKVYWVNPKTIRYSSGGNFDKRTDIGRVKGGDWDFSKKRLEESLFIKGLEERFIENRRWEDTTYYQNALEKLHSGEMPPWTFRQSGVFSSTLCEVAALLCFFQNS